MSAPFPSPSHSLSQRERENLEFPLWFPFSIFDGEGDRG